MAAMVEWRGGFFFQPSYRQFVKEVSLWWHHRLQWRVYMAKFWPSTMFCRLRWIIIDNDGCDNSGMSSGGGSMWGGGGGKGG